MNDRDTAPMSGQLAAKIREALARAERGQVVDLGSFAQYADDDALREVAELVSAVLRYAPAALEAEIYPVAFRLGAEALAGPEATEKALREALGLDAQEAPDGDPAGTVTDLASGEPRTVTRDGDCLLIPALRLDAEGCKLLRTIINGEMVELEASS